MRHQRVLPAGARGRVDLVVHQQHDRAELLADELGRDAVGRPGRRVRPAAVGVLVGEELVDGLAGQQAHLVRIGDPARGEDRGDDRGPEQAARAARVADLPGAVGEVEVIVGSRAGAEVGDPRVQVPRRLLGDGILVLRGGGGGKRKRDHRERQDQQGGAGSAREPDGAAHAPQIGADHRPSSTDRDRQTEVGSARPYGGLPEPVQAPIAASDRRTSSTASADVVGRGRAKAGTRRPTRLQCPWPAAATAHSVLGFTCAGLDRAPACDGRRSRSRTPRRGGRRQLGPGEELDLLAQGQLVRVDDLEAERLEQPQDVGLVGHPPRLPASQVQAPHRVRSAAPRCRAANRTAAPVGRPTGVIGDGHTSSSTSRCWPV